MCHDESFLPEESGVGSLDHPDLAEPLHRINPLRGDVSNELYLSECTASNELDDVEVIRLHPQVYDVIGKVRVCRGRLVV